MGDWKNAFFPQAKPCPLAQKGSFSAISHYVFNECRPSTVFESIPIFVVRNRRKWPVLGPKNAPFCCRNANLTNGTYFTHFGGGVGEVPILFFYGREDFNGTLSLYSVSCSCQAPRKQWLDQYKQSSPARSSLRPWHSPGFVMMLGTWDVQKPGRQPHSGSAELSTTTAQEQISYFV